MFSISCRVAFEVIAQPCHNPITRKSHPHWATRACRKCDKKNATRQEIGLVALSRTSAPTLENSLSCRARYDKHSCRKCGSAFRNSSEFEKFKIGESWDVDFWSSICPSSFSALALDVFLQIVEMDHYLPRVLGFSILFRNACLEPS